MPLPLSLCPMARCSCVNQFKVHDLAFRETSSVQPNYTPFHCINPQKISFVNQKLARVLKIKQPFSKQIARKCMNSSNELIIDETMDNDDQPDQKEIPKVNLESPWEGAVMYQRNPSVSHVEFCTTLERLGLGRVSTEASKSRASLMGLRVTKSVKDFPSGTPVLISVDVTRKNRRLRLDGILRTVIALSCMRCGQSVGQCLFQNFSLLLTEDPIEEPETIDLGVIFGDYESQITTMEDDDSSIDLDDWIYFPPQEKVVDISKHMRDMIHLEITFNGLCDPNCKGSCHKCGTNLNNSSCKCGELEADEEDFDNIRIGDEEDFDGIRIVDEEDFDGIVDEDM